MWVLLFQPEEQISVFSLPAPAFLFSMTSNARRRHIPKGEASASLSRFRVTYFWASLPSSRLQKQILPLLEPEVRGRWGPGKVRAEEKERQERVYYSTIDGNGVYGTESQETSFQGREGGREKRRTVRKKEAGEERGERFTERNVIWLNSIALCCKSLENQVLPLFSQCLFLYLLLSIFFSPFLSSAYLLVMIQDRGQHRKKQYHN